MRNIFLLSLFSFFLVGFKEQVKAQSDANFKKEILESHNFWRGEVGVAPLKWSELLEMKAKSWAETLAQKGCYLENSPSPYGENLFKGTTGQYDWDDIVDSWGLEADNYDIDSNECAPGSECGHYKQIVWERTTDLGCAAVECSGTTILVCFYNPRGNYQGVRPYTVGDK